MSSDNRVKVNIAQIATPSNKAVDKSTDGRVKINMPFSDYGPIEQIKKLNGNLALPSYVHGYSLAIEYMNKWFVDKFDKDYFKSVYIDGKHVIDDYKKFSKMVVKGENPRARIEPRVEYDYDREGLDDYQAPPEIYLQRSPWQTSFFKDYDRDMYLGFIPRAMRMDFNFKVRVNTRAQQQDAYNRMELYFRIGATQKDYINVDFHVPKSIMLNIAINAGFKVKNGEVVDIISFLHYLNQHSDLPFLFKLRAINQQPEFFIRLNGLCAHIATRDKLQLDDGERDGKLDFNFHVEMNAVLTMPVPHYFAFYSAKDLTIDVPMKEDVPGTTTVALYTVSLFDIPKTDEHGWNIAASTEYLADKGERYIDISPIFQGNNVLSKTLNHDMLLGVNPSHFINVKVFRDTDVARLVKTRMHWENNSIEIYDGPLSRDEMLHIVIYYDRDYISEVDAYMNKYNDTRIQSNKPK